MRVVRLGWDQLLRLSGLQASILAFRLARSNSASCSFCLTMKVSASLPNSGMGTVYSASKVTFVPLASGWSVQRVYLPLILR